MIEILKLWTATMILLATCAADTGTEIKCTPEAIISLSLGVGTNETGHVNVNGRLQQPQGNGTWHVDVEYGRSRCSSKQTQTKFLTFHVTGGDVKNSLSIKKPPLGYTLFPGMGYFRASKVALSWQAAKEACERDGAQLATADSQAEAEFLATKFSFESSGARSTSYAWYGASDIAQEGKYVTVTGTLVNETGYGTYQPGYPSGGSNQNCLIIYKTSGMLEDEPCSYLYSYLCKVPV